MRFIARFAGILAATLLFAACETDPKTPTTTTTTTPPPDVPQIPIPDFSGDTAFAFVKKQVDFGPRVPNTAAHKKCADWLVSSFKSRGLSVIEQKFTAVHYKGGGFQCVNIIAQYKPDNPRRVLLAAHWDSRFMADKDDKDQNKPIDGADDGASGVAVMLEIARLLEKNNVDIGVDLICFDAEDQGDDGAENPESWCLGSQHWSKNIHRPGYQPYVAILLDLVGAKGAKFPKEGVSMEIAPTTVEKIWSLADKLGYGGLFVNQNAGGITDDHVFVIRNARIPMIDVIGMPNQPPHVFGDYHHKHADNINVIDKNVLKAVGQVMTAVIYGVHNRTF